jgi:glycosyltransferase involved in cell wall biosynthesis
MSAPRLAVICDLLEEGWPSMDLATDSLLEQLAQTDAIEATRIRPAMKRRFSCISGSGLNRNADRFLNRFLDYPRHLRAQRPRFDAFHVGDHSYAQLVHVLPEQRTGVFCHDLDTFACILTPASDPRPRWFRAMARRILRGFEKAAIVFHSTAVLRRSIEEYGLVDPARLVLAPYGIAAEFGPEAAPEPSHAVMPGDAPFVLHVGSCVPRKRTDVLLAVFAELRARQPSLRLVQVGGEWRAEQRRQIESLRLADAIVQVRGIERRVMAGLYRRAALVLQPSEREGFGLPVIEALACGAIVVASAIPPIEEIGAEAVVLCPVGDVSRWVETSLRLLSNPGAAPAREIRLARARRYSWREHARIVGDAYLRLLAA